MKKIVSLLLCALFLVCQFAPKAFATAEVRYTVDGVTKEGLLTEAIEAVSPRGGEIVLLQDIHVPKSTRSFGMNMQSSFTLDLNGHIFSAYRPVRLAGKGILGTTLITDSVGGGALVGENFAVSVVEGGLHLKGVTVWSKKGQAISYHEFTGDYNVGNIIEDCIVGSSDRGALSFNNSERTQKEVYFTVRNSTLVNCGGDGYAVMRQEKATAANLDLRENVRLISGTKGDVVVQPGIALHGEKLTKAEDLVSVEIAGNTFEGYCWQTPAVATTAAKQHPPLPKTYSAWDTYFVSEIPA